MKTRVSDHEPTIREFSLGPAGLTIGAVLRDFDGVLSGTPMYRGSTRSADGDRPPCTSYDLRGPAEPAGVETVAAEHRVLVLAPRGRDAELAAGILARAGMACRVCADLADLVQLAATARALRC